MEENTHLTLYNPSNESLYTGLYELSLFKIIAIISSIANIVFLTPLFYSIIWYEKYGSGIHRTLINQLVSSCCWVAICYNTFVQIPEVIFSFVDAAPEIVCQLAMTVHGVLVIRYNLLLLSISVVKYVYIFIMKSPAGLNDNFWHHFININITFLASLSQIAFLILPGKFPFTYYVCTGTDPRQINGNKHNVLFVLSIIANLIVYIFVFVKIKMFKLKDPVPALTVSAVEPSHSIQALLGSILNTTLADFTTMAVGISFGIIFQSLIGILSSADTEKLGIYPYKIIYHTFQHLIPLMMHGLILLYYFKRHKKMRKAVWVKILQLFTIII